MIFCKYGHRRFANGGSPSGECLGMRVRLVLFLLRGISRLSLEMTTCPFGFIRLYSPHSSLGSLRSHSCHLPPRGKALIQSLFNVISTEALAKWRNPPRKSADNATITAIFDLAKYRYARLAAGRGRPALPRQCTLKKRYTATLRKSPDNDTTTTIFDL